MSLYITLFEKLAPFLEETKILYRNEILVESGCLNTNLYFIKSGTLQVCLEDEEQQQTIRFGYEGSFITTLDSFIKEVPTIFTVQAIKRCTVQKISKENYRNFLLETDENRQLWQLLMEDLIYQQLEREVDILTVAPKKRLERVLLRSPHLFQKVPQKYIASYLRMTPETLSRILKNIDLNQ